MSQRNVKGMNRLLAPCVGGAYIIFGLKINAHSENFNHHSMDLKTVPAVSTAGIPDPKHPLMVKETISKAIIG
jgi:hypothetical protein